MHWELDLVEFASNSEAGFRDVHTTQWPWCSVPKAKHRRREHEQPRYEPLMLFYDSPYNQKNWVETNSKTK